MEVLACWKRGKKEGGCQERPQNMTKMCLFLHVASPFSEVCQHRGNPDLGNCRSEYNLQKTS